MMKYRGPTDQHKIVERRYLVRLVVGLTIMTIGVGATIFGAAASQATVLAPNPVDPGAGPVEVRAPGGVNTGLGLLAIIIGTIVNLFSIRKYKADYAEIKEKEPRPEGMFVLVGLLITLLFAAVGAYAIYSVGS